MASWLSGEIQGVKNRLSSVQQKSKIPVRLTRLTRLNNNSGKSSSSKDEADKKQRILRDSAEKFESKLPSRIPIVVGRTNRKTVRDKLPKSVTAATEKRPLGRESGINLRETQGKQAGRIARTANRPTSTTHSNPEPAEESTPPARRRMLIRKVTPFNTKQVSNDEKEPRNEKSKEQDKSVQSADFSSTCKVQRDHNPDGDITAMEIPVSGGLADNTRSEYAHLREEVELLKGSLDLCNHREELLRRQVDGLKKGQAFKREVKTVLESSAGVSTSCEDKHKKEFEQLEKGHSEIVEELQQWIEDGDKENRILAETIEKNSDENVKLLAQISIMKKELKALAKENNTLQTELETKRTDLKSLRFQVDTLEAEVSRFKTSELEFKSLRDETSSLIDKLEVQLDTLINETTKIISEKDQELSKLNDEKSTAVDQLNDRLAACTKEKARIISENDEEKKELRDAKSKIVDQLNKRLVSNERKRHNYFREG